MGLNFSVPTKSLRTCEGRTRCTGPLWRWADKQAVSCCVARRHIYYLFFSSAQFIFQHQLKAYSCLQVQNTLGFSHSEYSLCFVHLFVLQRGPSACSLQILNKDIIRLYFSKSFHFLRRVMKATSITNRETFVPNKVNLYTLSKMKRWCCIVNSLIYSVAPIVF